MTAGRSRGKVWRACASAWAQLPPAAVQVGDRVAESVVRDALDLAVRFLSAGSGKDPVGDRLEADWVTAAFATLDRDGDGLVGYEDFLDIVEQYWDLAALAGNSVLVSAVSNQVRPVQEEQDGRQAQVERLCGQAFLWVDPEGVEALTVSQAKTALAVVFNCIGVPNPPDEWHNIAFQNFDEDADGLIEFEEMHEIALQHCELIWEGGLPQLPETAGTIDGPAPEDAPGRYAGAATAKAKPQAGLAPPPRASAAAAAVSAPPGSAMGAAPNSCAPGSCIEVLAVVLQEQGKPSSALDEALLSKEECRQMIESSLQRVPGSTLPPDEWCDLAFRNFDEDGDGRVTAEEAAEIMEEWLTLRPPEPGKEAAAAARTSAMPPSQEKPLADTGVLVAKDVFSPPARTVLQDSSTPAMEPERRDQSLISSPARDSLAPSAVVSPAADAGTSALDPGSSPALQTAAPAASLPSPDVAPAAEAPTSIPAAPQNSVAAAQQPQDREASEITPSPAAEPPPVPSQAVGIGEAAMATTAMTHGEPNMAPARVADASEVAVAAAMATALSRKTVNPRKTVRLDDAAPVTHEIPGTQHRSSVTTVNSTVFTSTVSSLKSEVYDIYGTLGGGSTSSQSTATARPRHSTAEIVPHRKSVVPVAAQIMVPAYSGQLRVFSDYEFKEEKGGGAFGRVMRVQHKRMGLQRACKAVAIRGARQFELVETEVSLMRKLDHPNVLRLFESYYDGERNIYLIIELCNGGSMTDRMAAHQENGGGGLPEAQVASAMQDLLTALQYCHRKGIIHRDIKPDNLLYVHKASDSKLKVIDFGLSDFLAKIEQRAHEAEKHGERKDKKKRAAPRIGTPHYMAAEVYLEGIYDERVDTFACGVVLAEALTGVHPFFELCKDNLETIRAKILRGKVDFKAVHWESVPVLAKQLAGQLLEPDRRKRFDASQALAHPWLVRNRSLLAAKGAELKRQVFDGLSRFRRYNVLKQAASRVIAKQLDDTHLGALQQQFQLLDADCSGSLSAAELQEGSRCCGRPMELLEVREILQGFDRIQSSSAAEIYYTDFLAALLEYGIALSEAQLREVYLRFSSGLEKIHWHSLEAAIRAANPSGIAPGTAPPPDVPASGIGEDATELELRQVFAELGGSDGCIDFRAFASMWVAQERI